jgi:predicted alpha/beta-hydrolase family hydrolase
MCDCAIREFVDTAAKQPPVRGFLHTPSAPAGDCLVLTHGAGANCQSPLLRKLADAFCGSGTTVLRCDLPFRQLRPHGPPMRGSAELDQQGLRRAVEILRPEFERVYLGGHSYGGRQASMLAAREGSIVDGLLLLSYPLHPPKKPEQMRTAHFPDLRTPALFVHGSRDGFGSIAELTAAMQLIPVRTELFPIQGAGHELISQRTVDELPPAIASAFRGMFDRQAST